MGISLCTDPFVFESELSPITVKMGAVATPHHQMTMKVKTLPDKFSEVNDHVQKPCKKKNAINHHPADSGSDNDTEESPHDGGQALITNNSSSTTAMRASSIESDEEQFKLSQDVQVSQDSVAVLTKKFEQTVFRKTSDSSDFQSCPTQESFQQPTLQEFKAFLLSYDICPTITEMKNKFGNANYVKGFIQTLEKEHFIIKVKNRYQFSVDKRPKPSSANSVGQAQTKLTYTPAKKRKPEDTEEVLRNKHLNLSQSSTFDPSRKLSLIKKPINQGSNKKIKLT
jgi:hypothetical protein